jgi:hypothetical protein
MVGAAKPRISVRGEVGTTAMGMDLGGEIKTHGRTGCRNLATGSGTTDSSVEQRPEVDCPYIEAIAQAAAWSALRQ